MGDILSIEGLLASEGWNINICDLTNAEYEDVARRAAEHASIVSTCFGGVEYITPTPTPIRLADVQAIPKTVLQQTLNSIDGMSEAVFNNGVVDCIAIPYVKLHIGNKKIHKWAHIMQIPNGFKKIEPFDAICD